MKQKELEFIIENIVKAILKEIEISTNTADPSQLGSGMGTSMDTSLSSADQAKMKRQADINRRDQIKQKEQELKVANSKMDAEKKDVDNQRGFQVPNLTKQLQMLKGARI